MRNVGCFNIRYVFAFQMARRIVPLCICNNAQCIATDLKEIASEHAWARAHLRGSADCKDKRQEGSSKALRQEAVMKRNARACRTCG